MKKLFMLAIMFVALLIPLVSASDFDVAIQEDNNRIRQGEIATFNITLTNLEDQNRVYSMDVGASASSYWILTPTNVAVTGGESKKFVLRVLPSQQLTPSLYNLALRVQTSNKPSITQDLQIRLLAEGYVSGFVPNLDLSASLPDEVNPRDPLRMKLEFVNRNQRVLNNLSVEIRSDLFESELTLDVDSLERLSREVQLNLDPFQEPGEYIVNVRAYDPVTSNYIAEDALILNIGSFSSVESSTELEESFLVTKTEITAKNLGNAQRKAQIYVDTNWFTRLFTSATQDISVVKEESQRKILWEPTLASNEEKSIVLRTSYWSLAIAIVILIIAIIAYYNLRSPLIIKKQVSFLNDGEGSSDIKVRLFIKNRSKKKVYNVSITDKIPRITEYVASGQLGYVKPDKVNKTSAKGTMMYWSLDSLDSLEERIIAYNLKSKLKIVGDMSLPKTRVKFEGATGSQKITMSSNPFFKR